MANIGTFTRNGNTIEGQVNTLKHQFRARLEPIEQPTEDGPHFRIFSGTAEVGAAWERTSRRDGTVYYSLSLDDVSFDNPIYANLVVEGEEFTLIWSRPKAA